MCRLHRDGPDGAASNTAGRYRGSRGSCTLCLMVFAFQRGCCRPADETRSLSGAPCGHTRPARTHRQLSVGRLLRSGSPARCRRTHSKGSAFRASSGHTSSTAKKGRSFSIVPSLAPGAFGGCASRWPAEQLRTIYARGADFVSWQHPNKPPTLHALHTVHAVPPNLFSDSKTVQNVFSRA